MMYEFHFLCRLYSIFCIFLFCNRSTCTIKLICLRDVHAEALAGRIRLETSKYEWVVFVASDGAGLADVYFTF